MPSRLNVESATRRGRPTCTPAFFNPTPFQCRASARCALSVGRWAAALIGGRAWRGWWLLGWRFILRARVVAVSTHKDNSRMDSQSTQHKACQSLVVTIGPSAVPHRPRAPKRGVFCAGLRQGSRINSVMCATTPALKL